MRLRERTLSVIVNFLLGIAWALMLIGAVTSFFTYLSSGFLTALVFGVMGMIPGAIAILLLEHFFTLKASYYELEKQTTLLRQIKEKLEK